MGDSDKPSESATVKFNVGGRIFEVLREPTLSLHPGTLLASLAEEHDGGEPVFVEADPDLFPYVLQYFRDRKILIPHCVSKAAVLREVGKMGLTSLTAAAIEQEPLPWKMLAQEVAKLKKDCEENLVKSQAKMLADVVLCVVFQKALVGERSITVTCVDIQHQAIHTQVFQSVHPLQWVNLRGVEANELANKRLNACGMHSTFTQGTTEDNGNIGYHNGKGGWGKHLQPQLPRIEPTFTVSYIGKS